MDINKEVMKQVVQEKLYLEYSEGDFLYRCLPMTYEYYGKMHLYKKHLGKEIDDFDDFIISEIPLFKYLCEKYYQEKKKPKLMLSQISNERQLLHFDQMIVNYLKNKKDDNYQQIVNLYIYMLEEKLTEKLCKE